MVVGALQLVELLLAKMASEYRPSFRREGVLHEIEIIADQQLTPKPKDAEPPPPGPSAEGDLLPVPVVSLPATKRSSSHIVDPQDAVTLRGRVVRFKYLSGTVEVEDAVFAKLRSLVARISEPGATEGALKRSLNDIADLFASPNTSVSSFELLQSGLVDGLLEFATVKDRAGQFLGLSNAFLLTPYEQLMHQGGSSSYLKHLLNDLSLAPALPRLKVLSLS